MALAPSRILDAPAVLDAAIRGRVIRPGDDDYDAARRVHNLAYDAYPALIVRVADAGDVATAIEFAAETGLELAVRGGSHSLAGHSTGDGVLVIDLSAMKGLHIDPDRALVWAEAGLTAGEVTNALAEHGLAVPFGDTGNVGIAGLTLGGGIGYLARKHGLAIDHLVSAELVTGDGELLTVSATEHPDLFWAIRGGGGNFGIVTRFVYEAVPVGMVYGGALALPATPEVLAGLATVGDTAPDELTIIAGVMTAPPMPFVPEDWVGKLVVFVTGVFDGDLEAGAAAFAPIRALAEPVVDLLGPMPYPTIYQITEGAAQASPNIVRSAFVDTFDDEAARLTLDAMSNATSPGAMFQLRPLRGAVARVAPEATAFAHREARFLVAIITLYDGDAAPHLAWTESLFEALRPLARGVYSNFVAAEGEARVRDAYPDATYARLAAVKAEYDPDNVFHRNQNIRPAR
jgi:FAD/FMN-containing dehydrogenase